jgi:hypothetical protein
MLVLKVKNTSSDVYFCPTDPAFARRKQSAPRDVPPYNGLMVGKSFYMGGASLWPDSDFDYEYIEGQEEDARPLAPGEERTIVIAGDLDIREMKEAFTKARDQGVPVQWRVQLRRGLDRLTDPSGEEHDISVTAVVGVMLDSSEIPF